jgi:hypothetical protein
MIPMTHRFSRLSKGVFAAVASLGILGSVSLVTTQASAQEYVYPPAEYVATADPVYYNGYAHYYYGNHWYYRDHYGRWAYYHGGEPAYFHDYHYRAPYYRYGHWHR